MGAKKGGSTANEENMYEMSNQNKTRETKTAWTEDVWNPVTGCTKCTEECRYCYAENACNWHKTRGNPKYANGFKLTIHPEELEKVKKFRPGSRVLLPSMSDLFHEYVPDRFIEEVVTACETRPDVTFLLLTMRAKRMAAFFENRPVPQNVWLGVTIGHWDQKCLEDLNSLKYINATVRFINAEPLLADIGPWLNLSGIDWVIVGGESGPGARRMYEGWVWNVKLACDEYDIPFFFKQWGAWGPDGVRRNKELNGCLLIGQEYKNYPNPRL